MNHRLKGKVAMVRRLAADGASVGLSYVASPDKAAAMQTEIEAVGRRAMAIKADAEDAAQVVDFVRAVQASSAGSTFW